MLNGDVFVLLALGCSLGGGKYSVGFRRDVDLVRVPAAACYSGDSGDLRVKFCKYPVHVGAHFGEKGGNKSAFLVKKSVGKVFGSYLKIIVFYGDLLGFANGFYGFLGEFFCVHCCHLVTVKMILLFRQMMTGPAAR